MIRYKAWLSIERIDDENDEYVDVAGPVCIGDFDAYADAHRFARALVTVLEPEENDDYAFPLEGPACPDCHDINGGTQDGAGYCPTCGGGGGAGGIIAT